MLRFSLGLLVAALWMPVAALFVDGGYLARAQGIALLTVPLTALVASPVFYLIRQRLSLLWCMGVGTGVGLVGTGLITLAIKFTQALEWAPTFVIAGVISAMLFWLVGVWRNSMFERLRVSGK